MSHRCGIEQSLRWGLGGQDGIDERVDRRSDRKRRSRWRSRGSERLVEILGRVEEHVRALVGEGGEFDGHALISSYC